MKPLKQATSDVVAIAAILTAGAVLAAMPAPIDGNNTVMMNFPPAFAQQGLKLVGTDASGHAVQGYSVSLSADGNTAVVGGYSDSAGAGAAWVWTRSGGVWSKQQKLFGSGAVGTSAEQGFSVAVSADGNTAIFGGPADNNATLAGAAWVWTRSGGVWTQQGNKLFASDGSADARQGYSVSLSADGNTAIVGGPFDNNYTGAAWVWARNGGVWSEQQKLVASGTVGIWAQQGVSVSLSADGNTALVGGWWDGGFTGAAWVWARSGGTWGQQGTKLVGLDAVGPAHQGRSVSLSADGSTAIVGGPVDNANSGDGAGAAWIWTRSGGLWSPQGSKLVAPDAVGPAQQGWSVSLSADGNTAIVGGNTDDGGPGASWVWSRSGGAWSKQQKLFGSGAAGVAYQGQSVSISADGSTALVGGPQDNSGAGAAWVFSSGSASATLGLGSASGSPGGSACVDLSLTYTGTPNIVSLATDITYDASKVTPTVATTLAAGKTALGNVVSPGLYRMAVYGGTGVFGAGTVASVCFTVASGFQQGSTQLCHASGTPTASDIGANAVSITGTCGSITAQQTSRKAGDCDGSGTVSATELQQVVNNQLGISSTGCGDCDGDGVVGATELQKAVNCQLGLANCTTTCVH